MTLAQIEAALSKKPEDALEGLVELWRKSFDPELGKLIERLGAQLARPLEGLPTKKKERAAALAALAKKTPLAQRSAVLAAFENFAREATGALVWPSVEAWGDVKPDPRVARMALRVLSQSTHHLTAKLWRRLTNCLEHHADLAVVEEARAYEQLLRSRGGGWGFSLERFSNVLKKLTARRRCVLPADPAAIERLNKAIGDAPTQSKSAPRDDAAMIEAIVSAPTDDTPRLVYADWLTEQHDPRGEFITLQVQRAAGGGTKASRAREDALLADHRSTFLGPFKGSVEMSGLRFDRGFLVAAKFNATVRAHPLTRLLERANIGEFPVARGARFDCLRSLTVFPEPADERKLLASVKLTELNLTTVNPLQTALDLIFSLPSLAELKHLSIYARADAASFSTAGASSTLQTLTVTRWPIEASFKRTPRGWDVRAELRALQLPPEAARFLRTDGFKRGVASIVLRGPGRIGLEPIAQELGAKLVLR